MPGFNVGNLDGSCNYEDGFPNSTVAAYIGPSNTIETARRNRYRISVMSANGQGQDPLNRLSSFAVYAYKCTRPSVEYSIMQIHNGAEQITRPGKISYNEVEFSFYEIVDTEVISDVAGNGSGSAGSPAPPSNRSLGEAIRDWHSKAMYNRTMSMLNRPSDFLATVVLQMLDGSGKPVYWYKMFDCWPSKITPSELSYVDGDISDITVTLQLNKFIEGAYYPQD